MWVRRIALLLLFLVVLAGIGAAFASVFFYDFFVVPTAAMEPTLQSGDRLLIRPLEEEHVDRGRLVVFRVPDASGASAALRIVGLPGEVVDTDDGEVTIDGDELAEDWAGDDTTTGVDRTKVPKAHVYLLGDNREESTDSRIFGPVPIEHLTGRVTAIWWPLDRAGDV